MKPLPALLSGAIAQEYGERAYAKKANAQNDNQTCGSDCSDAGADCQETTCSNQQEEQQRSTVRTRKQAFSPVVSGWNEPPAAHV
jgi:hypothetical protein